MSAKRFKVGDKVRVRSGLIKRELCGDMYVNDVMPKLAGEVLTVGKVEWDCYHVNENDWVWSDEMLEPEKKTLYNLEKGDMVYDDYGMRKVLLAIDGCYFLSHYEDDAKAGVWYTAADLDDYGYKPAKTEVEKLTIEVKGKKYEQSDIEEAIKDLKPVE